MWGMLKCWAGVAVLPLLVAAVAEEPQQADWQAEEAAILREAGLVADKKAAAVNHAAEQTGGYGYLPEEDEHVISHSKLFSVSGGDSLRMGAIASRADALYGQVRKLLNLDKTHKHLISIRLIGKSTDSPMLNPIRTRINIIDNHPNFQIRIHPGGGIDLARLDKAIITIENQAFVDGELAAETVMAIAMR